MDIKDSDTVDSTASTVINPNINNRQSKHQSHFNRPTSATPVDYNALHFNTSKTTHRKPNIKLLVILAAIFVLALGICAAVFLAGNGGSHQNTDQANQDNSHFYSEDYITIPKLGDIIGFGYIPNYSVVEGYTPNSIMAFTKERIAMELLALEEHKYIHDVAYYQDRLYIATDKGFFYIDFTQENFTLTSWIEIESVIEDESLGGWSWTWDDSTNESGAELRVKEMQIFEDHLYFTPSTCNPVQYGDCGVYKLSLGATNIRQTQIAQPTRGINDFWIEEQNATLFFTDNISSILMYIQQGYFQKDIRTDFVQQISKFPEDYKFAFDFSYRDIIIIKKINGTYERFIEAITSDNETDGSL